MEVGRPKELRRKFWTVRTYEILLIDSNLQKSGEIITSTGLAKSVKIEGNRIVFELENAETKNPQIVRALIESGMNIIELRERVPDLDAVYQKVIGGN